MILPNGSTVNLAGKVTTKDNDKLQISFFAPFSGKTGYIELACEVTKSTGKITIKGFWGNQKDKTPHFSCSFITEGSIYDSKKSEELLKGSGDKIFKFNATSTLEKGNNLNLPRYPMPVKIGKINAYDNIIMKPLLPKDVKLVVKKAKLILEKKSSAPFLPKGKTWNYETDKKGNPIIDPNVTTFTFNAKTGLFNGGFSVYYDFDENKKHFVVKTSYKGAAVYEITESEDGENTITLTFKGSAQLSCTDYEETATAGKFIKHTGKQPINVEVVEEEVVEEVVVEETTTP